MSRSDFYARLARTPSSRAQNDAKLVVEANRVRSTSRKGDGWDDAVSECFFAALRAEPRDEELCATRRAAEVSIGAYLERFCYVERVCSHLDQVSPIELEWRARVAAIAAWSTCPPRRVTIIQHPGFEGGRPA